MFSRAAKSVVKPLTSCRIHSGKNFKVASEISQILSKQSKNSTKLNALPLNDVAVINKPLSNFNEIYNFNENQLSGSLMKKFSSAGSNQPNARKINDNINLKVFNHQEDNVRSQIEKLVETLYRLPIAEEVAALDKPLMSSANAIFKLQTIQESLPGKLRESGTIKAVKKLKLKQIEAFLKRLLRPSMGVQEKCSYLKTECSLKPILGTKELSSNGWNNKFLIKILNSRLVCIRSFSSCMNRPKNMLIMDKTLDRITEESKRHFSKHLIMTECKQPFLRKSLASKSLCYTMVAASSSCLPSFKSCPPTETYSSTSLSYYYDTINLKYRNMLSYPCSLPVIHSKFVKNSQSLKIYNKYPLLLKNLKPPLPPSFKYSKLNFWELGKNKETDSLTYRDPSFLISLHKIHRRKFHISSFCFADSDKPSGCKNPETCPLPEVKKTEQSQSRNEKPDCYPNKNKCDRRQPKENKVEVKSNPEIYDQKIKDHICKKDCLARGKCEWPHTVPPPKMEYVKVKCPSPKFLKPNPCPLTNNQNNKKNDAPPIEIKKKIKKLKSQICSPPPLPKPPYGPITLCPCPPPSKMHPGPCPSYEKRVTPKPTLMPPCPLKEPYPCPKETHFCSIKKKPCKLFEGDKCLKKKMQREQAKTGILSNK